MKRRIISALKNFFTVQDLRITERETRKNYLNKRENLTESNLLALEDKERIIMKKFNDLRKRIALNGDSRFNHEQLYEYRMYKREYNQITQLKKLYENE